MTVARGRDIPTVELLYICDDDFKSSVARIRKKYRIEIVLEGDDETIPVESIINFDSRLINNPVLWKKYLSEINEVVREYEIEGLSEDLQTFVESGQTIYNVGKHKLHVPFKITSPKIKPRHLRHFDVEYSAPIAGMEVKFCIEKKINKSDLVAWVEKYADKITTQANDQLSESDYGITTLNKTERIVRVIQLRESKTKRTWEEIADKIQSENTNDPDAVDGIINAKSCAMLYKRYKKRFKKK